LHWWRRLILRSSRFTRLRLLILWLLLLHRLVLLGRRCRLTLLILLRRRRGLIGLRGWCLLILLGQQGSAAQQYAKRKSAHRLAVPNSVNLRIHAICLRLPC
jgi:hypothetical protein